MTARGDHRATTALASARRAAAVALLLALTVGTPALGTAGWGAAGPAPPRTPPPLAERACRLLVRREVPAWLFARCPGRPMPAPPLGVNMGDHRARSGRG